LTEKKSNNEKKIQENLTLTTSIKPFINPVRIGVLVMVIGFFVAVARRLTESMVIS